MEGWEQERLKRCLREKGYRNPVFVGRGTYAAVYRVQSFGTGGFYACKISVEKDLWRRESEYLSRLHHPLFPAYRDSWEAWDKGVLVMEYVPGQDLGMLLKRRKRISQREAVRIAAELAEGLSYLEALREPMLFRDLKPSNIRIREDGRVKLLDLGCACMAEAGQNSFAGTPGYAAPEQLARPEETGFYSDVYALGKLLHYMLTGDDPCLPPAKKPGIRNYDRHLSRSLEQLIQECVCSAPRERLPDMRRVACRLREWKEEMPFFVAERTAPRYRYEKNICKGF